MNTIDDFNFKDKKALIRVDFNVPFDDDKKVSDPTRIVSAKPTIDKVLNDGGSVVLMSHLGRPKGKEAKYSLSQIVETVSGVLGKKVLFSQDCIGTVAEEMVASLKSGEVLLLENLRFYEEESKGDIEFSKKLSKLGDIYINDAFGTAHRSHASTTIIAQFFPDNKCFGYLMTKEIKALNRVLSSGEKPVTAILGGSKVSSKITIIENMLDKVNHLIIGGGMAYTFIKAQGGQVGASICEDDKLDLALSIIEKAGLKNVKIHLPLDVVVADSFSNDAKVRIQDVKMIDQSWQGLDAGPKTLVAYKKVILESKTILWNGPIGVFEMPTFAKGTIAIGNFVSEATSKGAFSLVGGGDSVAAVKQFGFEHKVSYVSTGGGAMLESLEGITLPGIKAILN